MRQKGTKMKTASPRTIISFWVAVFIGIVLLYKLKEGKVVEVVKDYD